MPELIADLYERTASLWDEGRGKTLFEKSWLDRFTGLLPAHASILDIGCGSGQPIAQYLIAQGFTITGIDSSSAMISFCAQRFASHEWLVKDMRSLDLGRRFDGILAWHSFFHLSREDQRPMFARFASHLKPGGALMFTSGPADGEAVGEWQGEPLYHASLSAGEYEALLAEYGLAIVDHVVDDPNCGGATIWLARQIRPASGLDGSA